MLRLTSESDEEFLCQCFRMCLKLGFDNSNVKSTRSAVNKLFI